ncbi:hypothetical protein FB45DRAFT_877589 [Roridomyces roridus]|uniref:Uncharacterized protein n=1 Tax=Roridomyces roridus TaxID=1738132 RepID=A0AAD7F7Y5_9AGAR|nr:hypothetical protein FB45DRAFT_877589 [Roridomyces roridus]
MLSSKTHRTHRTQCSPRVFLLCSPWDTRVVLPSISFGNAANVCPSVFVVVLALLLSRVFQGLIALSAVVSSVNPCPLVLWLRARPPACRVVLANPRGFTVVTLPARRPMHTRPTTAPPPNADMGVRTKWSRLSNSACDHYCVSDGGRDHGVITALCSYQLAESSRDRVHHHLYFSFSLDSHHQVRIPPCRSSVASVVIPMHAVVSPFPPSFVCAKGALKEKNLLMNTSTDTQVPGTTATVDPCTFDEMSSSAAWTSTSTSPSASRSPVSPNVSWGAVDYPPLRLDNSPLHSSASPDEELDPALDPRHFPSCSLPDEELDPALVARYFPSSSLPDGELDPALDFDSYIPSSSVHTTLDSAAALAMLELGSMVDLENESNNSTFAVPASPEMPSTSTNTKHRASPSSPSPAKRARTSTPERQSTPPLLRVDLVALNSAHRKRKREKEAHRKSKKEQKRQAQAEKQQIVDEAYERTQRRKRRRVMRAILSPDYEGGPGGHTASDLETDPESDEDMDFTQAEIDAALAALSGDEVEVEEDDERPTFSDDVFPDEQDYDDLLDLAAEHSNIEDSQAGDQPPVISEDEDEDALDIETTSDREFVARDDEDNEQDSMGFYMHAKYMRDHVVEEQEPEISTSSPDEPTESASRSSKARSSKNVDSRKPSQSKRSKNPNSTEAKLARKYLNLAAKDSDGEEDDEDETAFDNEFLNDDPEPDEHPDPNEPMRQTLAAPGISEDSADEEQHVRSIHSRKSRYDRETRQEREQELRKQGFRPVSSSRELVADTDSPSVIPPSTIPIPARDPLVPHARLPPHDKVSRRYWEEQHLVNHLDNMQYAFSYDEGPWAQDAMVQDMLQVLPSQDPYVDGNASIRTHLKYMNQHLVREGEWVRLERHPRVIGYVLDTTAKKFLVKSIRPPRANRPLLQIRTEHQARTRKSSPVVHPTAEELEPFIRSNHRRLQKPHWGCTSFALNGGDRVFAVSGPGRKWPGLIEHLDKNSDGLYVDVMTGWPNGTPNPLLSDLRRHLLDPGPVPRVHDRVLVIEGAHLDVVSHIASIQGHNLTLEGGTVTGLVEVPIASCIRYFLPGDEVELRGEKAVVRDVDALFGGLVIILGSDAQVEVRRVRASDVNFVRWHPTIYASTWTSITRDRFFPPTQKEQDAEKDAQLKLLIAQAWKTMFAQLSMAAVCDEATAEEPATQALKLRAFQKADCLRRLGMYDDAADCLKKAVSLSLEHDADLFQRLAAALEAQVDGQHWKNTFQKTRDLEALKDRLMTTGKRFEGLEVKIVASGHPQRTRKGVITGDHDSEARRQRQEQFNGVKSLLRACRYNLYGILATIAYGDHQVAEKVPIEDIVEYQQDRLSRQYQLPQPLPDLPAERIPTPPPDPDVLSTYELPGETDGRWLLNDHLLNKRLDVIIEGTATAKGGRMAFKNRKQQKDQEGKQGFLLVEETYQAGHPIPVYGIQGQSMVRFTSGCLKPLRTKEGKRVDKCADERVVIFGPDHLDDRSHLGEYGQVLDMDNAPVDHAFVRHLDSSRGRYHWKALCLAENEERQHLDVVFAKTDFSLLL